jgi:hypothetical protein
MFAYYVGSNIERPYHFLSKVIICINFTPFLCKQILNINSLISGSICEIGYSIFSKEISFNNMIVHTNSYINNNSLNIFSFSGLLKSFITFGLINLLFSYSIRYILIKIFILITPFAILSLINSTSSWFFKSWFRNFISLLLVQSLIALVLLIIFSLDSYSDSILSQIIYISAIFVLTKANHYMKELFGGLTTDFNMNLSSLKNLIK